MTSVLSPLVCSPSLSPVAELGFAPDTSLCMAEELRAQVWGEKGAGEGASAAASQRTWLLFRL